ncbi:MAG: carboxypeptidase regulatory-like domain-containing protein [Thermoanaerobaculia bacterium]|nr:carboxypeptidase regulatory-like domain-containing protein [Thermoanaerobaculia bacterium]
MPEPLLIEVDADRETLLEEPVTLQTLRSLEIYIEPTTTPTGARWQIEMSRERATLPVLDVVAKGTASAAGFWRSQELALGKYRLSVNDPAGSSWLEQEIELETTGPPHQIEIPLIPIKGRVTLGKEPIRAIVSFGTTQGRPEIRLETNDDGELEGYLPREGEWPVELIMGEHDAAAQAIEPVFVEKPRGSEPADVDIELPNTELTGIVVENGAPVAGAGVVVIRYDAAKKRREAMLQTDEEGKFKLRGLSEGMLDLQARSAEKTSAWMRAHLQENLENQPLVLELATKIKVAGQVFSPSGPVAGANLVALPGGTPTGFALSVEAVTAADGTFTLETTADTRWLDVIIVPAGLPIRLDRLTVDKERKTPIILLLGAQGGDLLVAEMPNAPDPKVTLEPLKIIHGATEVDVRWLLKVLGHRRSRLDEQGIALLGLEAGEYSLCRASRGDCTTGFLAAAGQLALVTPSNLGNLESFRQLMETRR